MATKDQVNKMRGAFRDPTLVSFVKSWTVAKAMHEMLLEKKKKKYKEMLWEYPIYALDKTAEFAALGRDADRTGWDGHRIYDEKELYLTDLHGEDYLAFEKMIGDWWVQEGDISQEEADKGFCPELTMSTRLIEIENEFVPYAMKLMGMPIDHMPYLEKRKKLIDLIITGVFSENPGITSESILEEYTDGSKVH